MLNDLDELAGLRILVVEDELMIALMIEDILEDLKCEIAGPVSTIAKAMALIEECRKLDCACLDMNLNGETILPVAEKLISKRIPYVLVTGYGIRSGDPPALAEATRVSKPFRQQDLAGAIMDVL